MCTAKQFIFSFGFYVNMCERERERVSARNQSVVAIVAERRHCILLVHGRPLRMRIELSGDSRRHSGRSFVFLRPREKKKKLANAHTPGQSIALSHRQGSCLRLGESNNTANSYNMAHEANDKFIYHCKCMLLLLLAFFSPAFNRLVML